MFEGADDHTFVVHQLSVVARWRDLHPVTQFRPQPGPGPHRPQPGPQPGPTRATTEQAAKQIPAVVTHDGPGTLERGEAASETDKPGYRIFEDTTAVARSITVAPGMDSVSAAKAGDARHSAWNGAAADGDTGDGVEGGCSQTQGRCVDAAEKLFMEALPSDCGAQIGRSGGGHQSALCKFWAATGRCPKGGTCRYDHPLERGGATGPQQLYAQSRSVRSSVRPSRSAPFPSTCPPACLPQFLHGTAP